jgi:hypothetical protein
MGDFNENEWRRRVARARTTEELTALAMELPKGRLDLNDPLDALVINSPPSTTAPDA